MARAVRITEPPAVVVLRRLGGTATLDELLRFTTEHQVRTAVRAGALVRAARGVYVLPGLPEAFAAAARCRGTVSHETAARQLGLQTLLPPRAVHVTAARGAKPPSLPGVVVHRAVVRPEELHREVTGHVRTVVDCAATLPFREALAIADSALAARPDLARDLVEAAERRRGPGRQRVLRVVRQASGLAANPFESALRAIALEAGLTGFVPQYPVVTKRLGTVHVDLGDPALRIALEADSFAWHGSREALASDCFRYAEVERTGWLVVRFAWEHVMFEWDWVAEVLLDVTTARSA